MAETTVTNFYEFKGKECVFVADWLKTKGHTSFVLYLKVIKHVNVLNCFYNINNNFLRSITSRCLENKPVLLPWRHVWLGAFEQLFGPGRRNLIKIFQKSKCPGWRGCPGGGMLKLWFDWYVSLVSVLTVPCMHSKELGWSYWLILQSFSWESGKLASCPVD